MTHILVKAICLTGQPKLIIHKLSWCKLSYACLTLINKCSVNRVYFHLFFINCLTLNRWTIIDISLRKLHLYSLMQFSAWVPGKYLLIFLGCYNLVLLALFSACLTLALSADQPRLWFLRFDLLILCKVQVLGFCITVSAGIIPFCLTSTNTFSSSGGIQSDPSFFLIYLYPFSCFVSGCASSLISWIWFAYSM